MRRGVPISYLMYAFFACVAFLVLYGAREFASLGMGQDIGPARLPQVLAAVMLILVVVDVIVSRRQMAAISPREFVLAFIVTGLMGTVIWLAQHVGLFVVLPVGLFLGLVLAGARNHVVNVLYALIVPTFVWFVFDRSLQIPLSSF